jgi:uncharacterized membrane protein
MIIASFLVGVLVGLITGVGWLCVVLWFFVWRKNSLWRRP